MTMPPKEHRGVAVFSTPVGWSLDQQAGDKKPNGSVSAYAEGIDVISLDSRFLIRA
jgi:hypothetical protein